MKIKQNIIDKIKFRIADFKNEKLMKNLIKDPTTQIGKLGKSIEFVRKNRELTIKERNALELIKNLRKNLENSSDVILVKDFGSGEPNSNLSIQEMESGIEIKRNVKDICFNASSPSKFGELIFRIILENHPERCLELGTSLGISGAYQLAALNINNKGELITIEGSKNVAKIASKNFLEMGFSNFTLYEGRFKDVLSNILSKENLFDMVFIDGHHDKDATKEYFEQIYPFLSENSILIFDDINWSKGMSEVWEIIYKDIRINQSIDLDKWGICFINKHKENTKINYQKLIF